MKQRYSSLDIKVVAHELTQCLPSLRVSNIYDLSSRIFLFKFAKPDHRQQVVIDCGFRVHLTAFSRTTESAPSAFVSRLRKFLKTRRVTKIEQVGTDRILEIQFSDGQYRLFLEFYAGGNIILTDGELKIIAVQRSVNEGAEHEHVRLGSTYNLDQRQNYGGVPELTEQRVRNGLQRWLDRQAPSTGAEGQKKKPKKQGADQLRKALAGSVNEYPPMLLDHALRSTHFDITITPDAVLKDDSLLQGVMKALREAGQTVNDIMSQPVVKGYIVGTYREASKTEAQEGDQEKKVIYNDFHPFKPQQAVDDNEAILEYDGFNKAVDEFFSSIEGQKLDARQAEKEEAARKKMENAKQDQEKRIGSLQEAQALNVRKAQAIEANLERVGEATAAINSLIGQGMDWVEIDRLIEMEQKRHNPVAEIIKVPLKLSENAATLLLGEWDTNEPDADDGDVTDSEPSDSEGDERTNAKAQSKKPAAVQDKRLAVEIDLGLSAWSNAREYYDQKRNAAAKEEKTVQASDKALRSAQQKIEMDLKKSLKQDKATLRPIRQAFWFEKFIYFLSSDGYLVVGGKDPQQNELLFKKHLKKGDVYVHADLPAAVPLIIKNKPDTPDAPIPPTTLSQAGNMSVATSTAWDSKAVMSAWWAPAEKITKTAPTGDYLPVGKVAVIGDRLFLPPAQLILGFAVLFQITEQSKANHQKHRVPAQEDAAARKAAAEAAAAEAEETRAAEAAVDDGELADEEDDAASDVGSGDEHESDDNDDDSLVGDDEHGESHKEDDDARAYRNPLQSNDTAAGNQRSSTLADHHITAPVEESGEESTDENEADAEYIEEHGPGAGQAARNPAESHASSSQPRPKQQIPVRGKHGKKKKMAKKYAEQDDEDREEAMRLLGSKVGQERVEAEKEAARRAAEEAEQARQRRREQLEKKMKESKEKEEERLRRQAEDIAGDDDDDNDNAAFHNNVDLDTLVGTPRPGDTIVEAIPVCAPWNALARYKYKVKLQPGSVKKGKAVREILGRWAAAGENKKIVDQSMTDAEKIWPKEMECIKAWREGEVFGVLPVSKVRVMIAGGESAKGKGSSGAAGKGGGKKGAKNRGKKK